MWRRIGVILLWVLATVGTASITLAAVGQVGESTTEQAAVPVNAAELRSSPAVQRLASTTTTASPTTAAVDTTTTTAVVEESTTTTEGTAPATTSTTSATTTTTTAAQQGETVVRSLVGGTVTVFRQGSSVTLVSAVPASGAVWTVEVKDGGPEQVVVEFESTTHESHYQATVENGQLVIEIDESPGGGDD